MLVVKSAAVAALSSLALLTSTANAAIGCWYPNEAKAAQLRDLQTKLMVGTLRCRRITPSIIQHYNSFVTNQRALLEANNIVLKTRFSREESDGRGDGQNAYDRHHTASANYFSAPASDFNGSECARVVSLARIAAQMSHDEVLALAESAVEAPPTGPCRPSHYSFAEQDAAPLAPAVAAEPEPVLAEAIEAPAPVSVETVLAEAKTTTAVVQQAAEQPKIVEAPSELAVPVVEAKVEVAEAKVEKAVVAAEAAPAQAQAADALQAAVAALNAAAAALQAVASSGKANVLPQIDAPPADEPVKVEAVMPSSALRK